jgi:hypothetical protein
MLHCGIFRDTTSGMRGVRFVAIRGPCSTVKRDIPASHGGITPLGIEVGAWPDGAPSDANRPRRLAAIADGNVESAWMAASR